MNSDTADAPDILLLISSNCPHCETVLQHVVQLLKQGEAGRLNVENVTLHPELAEEYKVKTVPWMCIGPFELEGVRPLAELRQWCEKARDRRGMAEYFIEMLNTGKLPLVENLVRKNPHYLEDIVALVGNTATPMQVRIGIGALLEQLQGSGLAHNVVHDLGAVLSNKDGRIRCDAAHYLTLTESAEAIPYLEKCLDDDEQQVIDIACEGLEELQEKLMTS